MLTQTELANLIRGYVDPVVTTLQDAVLSFQPVFLRCLVYVFVFATVYLFHSPFRAQHRARVDRYARVWKVVQTWSLLVLACFHIGPKVLESQDRNDETVATVFFPIFFLSTLLFLLLHKVKRRLKMGITYGSCLSYILLNSIILALVATVHYLCIYKMQIFAKERNTLLSKLFSVSSTSTTPFQSIFHLFLLCIGFTGLDYLYKYRCGLDPSRGILWSDQYDLVTADYGEGTSTVNVDWRTQVPKPIEVKKKALHSPTKGAVESYAENTSFMGVSMQSIEEESMQATFNFNVDGEMKEVAEAKHPLDRPAMVPWWSTFVLITAWQTFAANVLGFLSFDVRLIQPRATPKIFKLNFVSKTGKEKSTSTPPTETWFDWIADVGDGFNSTYDMARVLSQPSVVIPTKKGDDHLAVAKRAEMAGRSKSIASDGLEAQGRGFSTTFEDAAPKQRDELDLPRGSFVIVGGDLAYPSPCDETYSTRLFGPYSDALRGNYYLRRLFHRFQRQIVEPDPMNSDVAHITLLDARSTANIVNGKDSLRQNKDTVEEALRTAPLLFAIPGNHDWFDGLSTYSKYIIEKTWMGGRLMPQRSSYFVLRLPANWFILCCDTGNTQDIDVTQKNYFLKVMEDEMDEDSCVILTCHEPGWLLDAMERSEGPRQPEIDYLVRVIGTRLRLRIAGDIHHYSRHVPKDPLSDAATLLVSGGGGAFLHGARPDKIIAQGTEYIRSSAFPRKNTYMTMASRLWGFRLVNWKFDVIVGYLCVGLIYSFLPLDKRFIVNGGVVDNISELVTQTTADTVTLVYYLFSYGKFSLLPFLFYLMCFSLAGADRGASALWRVTYGLFWSMMVVLVCCGMLVTMYNFFAYMQNKNMMLSSEGKWESMLEQQTRSSLEQLIKHAIAALGETSWIGKKIGDWSYFFFDSFLLQIYSFVLRCLDPVETFTYLSSTVASDTMGKFAEGTTRIQILAYYLHIYLPFWILVTPMVSFIIGTFLFISVNVFDYMYDGVYSAFQIEDYKHFLRFSLNHETRELTCYVIAREKVPKVWELDPHHLAEFSSAFSSHLPPHLRRFPSRWRPVDPKRKKQSQKIQLHDTFVVRPHRSASTAKSSTM